MIRLNDINKTVIDEKEIKGYITCKDDDVITESYIRIIRRYNTSSFQYDTKEARDKDIEYLNKLLDVKSIEDKVEERGEENKPIPNIPIPYYEPSDLGEKQVLVPVREESKPAKEEYLTWKEVKNSKKNINIKFSNGDIHSVGYDEGNERINFYIGYDYEGCIYEEDLFNALMLKKVE